MEKRQDKIHSFTDLNAWKYAHELVLDIYKITKDFPKEEIFGLVSQMRRSAVSVSSNIAEGFSRNTFKDKAQFYSIAQGSLTELQNQLLISRDIVYSNNEEFEDLSQKTVLIHKLINGLIKSARSRF